VGNASYRFAEFLQAMRTHSRGCRWLTSRLRWVDACATLALGPQLFVRGCMMGCGWGDGTSCGQYLIEGSWKQVRASLANERHPLDPISAIRKQRVD